ncbi:alpha/beta hydrolase-fold protein [uncultured Psychroserpens sp.]|uniref:alpha/beta hydrolase n=1 Tax=uncultured Psychroserpens sp. TaxID=255436 RepID=UPI002613760C|nr:alpha/beta hydrolase-fold protein [uncultured Psychroserpens sp.]
MKINLLFLCVVLCCTSLFSQTIYKELPSRALNTTRDIKIQLPENYDPESTLKHPVIIVFDGDYLFEPVSGQVHFQTYFKEMPQSIIVGIVQGEERFYDSYYDELTGMPFESGKRFYDFVQNELLPYIDNNYNTSLFRVAVGHNLMGNFINSYLFTDEPVFQAYINLSPDYKGMMATNLATRLGYLKNEVFYYLATSDRDIKGLRNNIRQMNEDLKLLDTQKLTFYYDELKGDTHYTLVTGAISKALDKIFEMFKPLDEKEINEKVRTYDGTLDKYIVDRYKRIEDYFGISKPITEDEFAKIVAIAEERNDMESLQKIGKLANKQDPNSSLGTYYLALHAEKIGKNKKATKYYESALLLDETSFIDKEFIKSKLEDLKLAVEEIEDEDDEEN